VNRIFVDTGAWYAFVDKKDPEHLNAIRFYNSNTVPLLTSNFVFDETVTLLTSRLGWEVAKQFGQKLKSSSLVGLVTVTSADEERAWEIFVKYKNAGFSYTDCTSFALMERLKINTAFTFDEHFKVMKLKAVGA